MGIAQGVEVKEAPKAPLKKAAPFGPAHFIAKFESECWICGNLIERGDLIKYDTQDHVMHAPRCDELGIRPLQPTKWDGWDDESMGF